MGAQVIFIEGHYFIRQLALRPFRAKAGSIGRRLICLEPGFSAKQGMLLLTTFKEGAENVLFRPLDARHIQQTRCLLNAEVVLGCVSKASRQGVASDTCHAK